MQKMTVSVVGENTVLCRFLAIEFCFNMTHFISYFFGSYAKTFNI